MTQRHAGGQVQVRDEVLDRVSAAVAIGIVIDRDSVLALGAFWRRIGHLVVLRPQPVVHFDGPEPLGIRILPILQHPHPATIVKTDRQGLRDLGLGDDESNLQPVGNFEPLGRLRGRKGGRMINPRLGRIRTATVAQQARQPQRRHPN